MSAVVGYAGKRLTAAGRTGTAYLLVPLGWVVQEWARGATPYGGFPWARLAFSQADSPLAHVARWLGAPGVTFAVATVGTLLLVAADTAVRRSWARAAVAAALAVGVAAARAAGHRPAHRRAPRVGRLRAGQRAAGRPGVQRPAPRGARQPRRRHRAARHEGPRRPQPRRLARELLRHRPVPQPRRRRADRPGARRGRRPAAHRGGARRAARLQLERLVVLPARGRGAAALREAAPGALRRVHPEPGLLPDVHPDGRPRGQLRRRPRGRDLPRAGHRRRLRGAADDLLRGGLRPADARQRRGRRRRREPARRADQQRDLRLHRRVRAAVRHLPDPRHRARPLGRARLDGRRLGVHRPRRHRHREDRRCSPPTSGWRARSCAPSAPRPTGSVRCPSGSPPPRSLLLLVGSTRAARSVRVSEPRPLPDATTEDGTVD